jgi:hypothetical protein
MEQRRHICPAKTNAMYRGAKFASKRKGDMVLRAMIRFASLEQISPRSVGPPRIMIANRTFPRGNRDPLRHQLRRQFCPSACANLTNYGGGRRSDSRPTKSAHNVAALSISFLALVAHQTSSLRNLLFCRSWVPSAVFLASIDDKCVMMLAYGDDVLPCSFMRALVRGGHLPISMHLPTHERLWLHTTYERLNMSLQTHGVRH